MTPKTTTDKGVANQSADLSTEDEAGNSNANKLEELKEKYEGNTYQIGGEDSRKKTFTVTEIGVSEYGHIADKGEIYSTIEYDDGYVCHPSVEVLERQIKKSEKVVR